MAHLKDETPGRVVVEAVGDGGLTAVEVADAATLEGLAARLYANLRLKADVHLSGQRVAGMSRLLEVHGRRISRPEDLAGAALPARLVFRAPSTRRLAVEARLAATGEHVKFELGDDALGERAVVTRVLEGPAAFRRAEQESWHVKTVNDRPVGKTQVRHLQQRLRKGLPVAFQDAVIPEHLSGPQMILEHFLSTSLLTHGEDGLELCWASEAKERLLDEAKALVLPANAMDEIVDNLGGLKRVAEMSGRSHRMKRRKDGTLAYVARCEELRCSHDGANLVEQVLFQKGAKKICLVTEVASAGISLHADRRQVRKDFQPPRRTMISVELPWGADKAIQCFGRVHRANQLVPPRFVMLCTPLGGEVRFISAIARRMKLLGAVTKGDRMTSMGGGADRHMADFDVNNAYGVRALETLYVDTTSTLSAAPELHALYEGLPFIGSEGDGEATGRWPRWEDFASEVNGVWGRLNLREEFSEMIDAMKQDRARRGQVRESEAINRFFNRILMLEVELQNALFETFFAVYSELVRIDCANGVYDDGVENLNQSQGRWIHQIEADRREVLYTDPVTGAETQYVRLRLDRGISWQAAREAHDALTRAGDSVQGFYAFRKTPESEPVYLLVKEREQVGGAGSSGTTWVSRRRRKQYVVWRADSVVRTGHDGGLHAFSAEEFFDERYERMQADGADLESVQSGWTQQYEASAESRLDFEHLLTGDVLSAWRLASGPAKSKGNAAPKLQIVRAVTQPEGIPVVGMRVAEEDLPQLKYVLGCQQMSTRDEPRPVEQRPSIHDICVRASQALLSRLGAAKDGSLPYSSWLEVHKELAAAEVVSCSVDGLRGVQQAVERLVRRGLISAAEGVIALKGTADRLSTEALEMKLFPEEFCASDHEHDNDGSDENGGSGDEACFGSDFDIGSGVEDEPGADASSGIENPTVTERHSEEGVAAQGLAQSSKLRKRRAKEVEAVPTPAKARRSEGAAEVEVLGSSSSSKRARRRHSGGRAAAPSGEQHGAAGQDDLFSELFGSGAESGEAATGGAQSSATGADDGARKRCRHADMARALFGDLASDHGGSGGSSADEAADTPVAAAPEEDEGCCRVGAQPAWTYEVIGRKLGIRQVPDTENTPSSGYLAPGEFFNATERLLGKDGRTYLRLADGRGWAYDRSAKDINKVVVRLIRLQ